MSWPRGTTAEHKAALDRMLPMARKIAKKRAALGRILTFDQCLDLARSALHDALMSHDGAKSDFRAYAHAKIDHALANANAVAKRRTLSPVMQALHATYAHATRLLPRGDVMRDSDEDALGKLEDGVDELMGAFGIKLSTSPEELYAVRETAREVQAALGELSEHHRTVVRLRYIEDHTLEQVGAALDTSVAQIFRDEAKALQQLQAVLRRRGFGGSRDGRAPPRGPDEVSE